MLRALYSGISGLRSHQTMLDVTGNNIANVNTTGFKGSSVQFQDTLSQLTQGASIPQETLGGTNAAQIGLGVRVSAITTNFTQGSAQATGRSTDMMINGDGFFMVQKDGATFYTRAGAFDFDAQGRLVTSDGSIVQGWTGSASSGVTGPVTVQPGLVTEAEETQNATMTGNIPSDGTDLQIIRSITTYDAEGTPREMTLTFQRDAVGSPWSVVGNIAGTNGANDPAQNTASIPLGFTDGKLTNPAADALGRRHITIASNGMNVSVDVTDISSFAGLSNVAITKQDGIDAGTLESYSFSQDGTIVGSFTNGTQKAIAGIALAKFVNPGGLEKAGDSMYRATINSGTAALSAPGSNGVGSLMGGSLEMSNVDLSAEFTNLIVAQRGFQANARIITTSDEVLQELTNLKR